MAETRISPYSLPDLKNTTDDALGNYLRSIGFTQDHSKTDTKLLLGYAAVIIAGVTFAADYKLGWEATKTWTAVAVVAYMILNAAFSYWLWFVEGGIVFEGHSKGNKISISSKTNKHEPTYYLTATSSSSPDSREVKALFSTWFTADGFFVAKPFQQWLASSVEAVGDVDSKNAMRDQRDELAAPSAEFETLEGGVVEATGTESKGKSSKRASKRRV